MESEYNYYILLDLQRAVALDRRQKSTVSHYLINFYYKEYFAEHFILTFFHLV